MNTPAPASVSAPGAVPPSAVPQRWLWAAVGVLGAVVLALGGALAMQQRGPVESPVANVPRTPEAEIIDERKGSEPRARPVPLQPLRADPAPSRAVAAPAPGRARSVSCANCGRVESVQAVEQAAPATGVGAVAGGVLGAVVGNQVGKGSGRAAATVLGAIGGGYVGHRVEQNTRTRTVYQVRVRMRDGSVRQFQRAEPVDVGMPVVVQGRGFRAAAAAPGDGPGGVVPPQ